MTARALVVVVLVAGVVAASLRAGAPPAAPDVVGPAPSVIAGGTARPGVSPGVLGVRLACDPDGTCTVAWETARLPLRVFAGPAPDRIDRATPVVEVAAGDAATFAGVPGAPTYVEVVAAGDPDGPVVGTRAIGPGPGSVRDLGGYRTRTGAALAWGRWFVAREPDAATSEVVGTLGLPRACPGTTVAVGPGPLSVRARRAAARSVRAWSAPTPTWIRCAARSGDWPVVLALTAAGVPRETVVAAVLALQVAEGRPTDRSAVDRPLEQVTARYGTFRGYLRDGLGLSTADVTAFRRAVLVGATGRSG